MTEPVHAVGGAASTSNRAESNTRAVVRMILAARGIGKDTLATTLGISRASLYERLNGRRAFTLGEVAIMAETFDVPVSIFFEGPSELLLGGVGGRKQDPMSGYFPTIEPDGDIDGDLAA